jgi:hypothetical protein
MPRPRPTARGRASRVLALAVTTLWLAWPLGAAQAAPPARLRALIVDGQSNHGWQETTAALRATLLNTGRFTVDVSTTPPEGAPLSAWLAWQPAFSSYDVVLTDYKGRMWPASVRNSLESYISGGGGLFIIHATLATFVTPNLFPGEVEWTAFSNWMALGWRPEPFGTRVTVDHATGGLIPFAPGTGGSSAHGTQHSFTVKSRNPSHPIMAGLPAEWLHGKDELYHAMRGPAANLDVLASAFSAPETGGTGQHEPMLWTTPFGLGRVVTTVMGHRWFGSGYGPPGSVSENGPDALQCAGLQTLIARSAEWAAGEDVAVPVPDLFPSSSAVSVRDPVRGVWLRLGLKVNGQHPAGDVVVTSGPVALTLDMAPGLWSQPLGLFFAFTAGGPFTWVTAGGLSATPAPLSALTPVPLAGVGLADTNLPAGGTLTVFLFFAEGSRIVAYDVITAAVPAGASPVPARPSSAFGGVKAALEAAVRSARLP